MTVFKNHRNRKISFLYSLIPISPSGLNECILGHVGDFEYYYEKKFNKKN